MKTTRSILLVDDDPFVMELLTLALREVPGWKVLSFASPEDALNAFASNPRGFDVVITDYVMPVMNGGELGRAVRALAPDVQTVLISGHAVAFAGGHSASFDAALAKPFLPSQLVKLVARLANGSRAEHESAHAFAAA